MIYLIIYLIGRVRIQNVKIYVDISGLDYSARDFINLQRTVGHENA